MSLEVNRGVHQAKELGGIVFPKPGVGKLYVKSSSACCRVLYTKFYWTQPCSFVYIIFMTLSRYTISQGLLTMYGHQGRKYLFSIPLHKSFADPSATHLRNIRILFFAHFLFFC